MLAAAAPVALARLLMSAEDADALSVVMPPSVSVDKTGRSVTVTVVEDGFTPAAAARPAVMEAILKVARLMPASASPTVTADEDGELVS